MRIQISRWRLDYDRAYGIDKQRGWSVAIDGCFVCQFRSFPVAIWNLVYWTFTLGSKGWPEYIRPFF